MRKAEHWEVIVPQPVACTAEAGGLHRVHLTAWPSHSCWLLPTVSYWPSVAVLPVVHFMWDDYYQLMVGTCDDLHPPPPLLWIIAMQLPADALGLFSHVISASAFYSL